MARDRVSTNNGSNCNARLIVNYSTKYKRCNFRDRRDAQSEWPCCQTIRRLTKRSWCRWGWFLRVLAHSSRGAAMGVQSFELQASNHPPLINSSSNWNHQNKYHNDQINTPPEVNCHVRWNNEVCRNRHFGTSDLCFLMQLKVPISGSLKHAILRNMTMLVLIFRLPVRHSCSSSS